MVTSSKIFAGSKLRRLRLKLGLSQVDFAQSLGLSASYLNLMERDQRPLTAQVVLKLSGMEGVDIAELAASDVTQSLLQPLREMAADPLLVGEIPPGNELHEALQAVPNFSAATLKLYTAYREALKRLAEAARNAPLAPPESNAATWAATRSNENIEGAAEDTWGELSPKDDIFAGLKARLRASFGIDTRILPTTVLGEDRSRYDRHAQRLLISETLGFEARIFEAAHLLSRLEGREPINAALATSPLQDNPEHLRQARAILFDHLALAVLMPRGRFNTSAEDLKYNLDALAHRFSVTQAQAMQRLAMLSESIGFLAIATTGQVTTRLGNLHFFLPKDVALCAQLPLFDEGRGPHAAEMKPLEGPSLIVLCIRDAGRAYALFFTPENFAKTNYVAKPVERPLGATCRLCEVKNCSKRTAASATRPAGLNDYIRGATDFEPV